MPSRDKHRKSRHGCTRCKQRRVKCDEKAPCRHCIRRKENCSLVDHTFDRHAEEIRFLDHLITNVPIPLSNWSQDLYLMSHFVASTAKSLSIRPGFVRMFQEQAPKDAMNHPFLMHGILAISALHLSATDEQQKHHWSELYQYHISTGRPMFRQALTERAPESEGPRFAMGLLVSAIQVAHASDHAPLLPGGGNAPVTFDTLISFYTLLKGLVFTFDNDWEHLPYGVDITSFDATSCKDVPLPEVVAAEQRELRRQVQLQFDTGMQQAEPRDNEDIPEASADDNEDETTCIMALATSEYKWTIIVTRRIQHELHGSMFMGHDEPWIDYFYLIQWIGKIPDHFVTLMRARHPAALLILIQWSSLMTIVEQNHWHLKNLGQNSYGVIQHAMGVS